LYKRQAACKGLRPVQFSEAGIQGLWQFVHKMRKNIMADLMTIISGKMVQLRT
jgi:hypothetical protein